MKVHFCAVAFALAAVPAFAQTYSTPVESGHEVTSQHGSLPGGEKSQWSTKEGETSHTGWSNTGEPTVSGNTSVQTQERSGTRTDVAQNPAGRTVGTDRFDQTSSWTETRQETTTISSESDKKCEGSCGNGNDGNGTGNEGNGKKK